MAQVESSACSAPAELSACPALAECSAVLAFQAAASAPAESSAAFRHRDCHRPAVSRLLDFHHPDSHHLVAFRHRDFLVVQVCQADTADGRSPEDSAGALRLVVCRHSEADDNPVADRHLEADDSPAGDSRADVRTTDNRDDTEGNSRRASKDSRNRRCDCK
jgi:hypothetical protein